MLDRDAGLIGAHLTSPAVEAERTPLHFTALGCIFDPLLCLITNDYAHSCGSLVRVIKPSCTCSTHFLARVKIHYVFLNTLPVMMALTMSPDPKEKETVNN